MKNKIIKMQATAIATIIGAAMSEFEFKPSVLDLSFSKFG